MFDSRRDRHGVSGAQALVLTGMLLWLSSCSPVGSRGTGLPGAELPENATIILKVRMRDQIVSVHADGPTGPGFSVASADGTPLSGLLTSAEFAQEFPTTSQRYEALMASDGGPLVDSAYNRPDSSTHPEPSRASRAPRVSADP